VRRSDDVASNLAHLLVVSRMQEATPFTCVAIRGYQAGRIYQIS